VASAQPERVRSTLLHTGDNGKSSKQATMKITFFCVSPDVISEPSRPQKNLKIAVYHFSCFGNMRPAPPANLELERGTKKSKNVPEIDNLQKIKKNVRESSWKNVVSELYRSQMELIFTGSESS